MPSHPPGPQVPTAPLHLMMGWTQHMWNSQNSATHPPTHFQAGFGTHTGKPQSPELSPPNTTSFPLPYTRHKNQTGKISLDGGPHIQLASPLCLYTPSCHWDSELFGTKVKSDLLLQSQCCISRCHEHKDFAHCLQMPESCTVFFLPSKYKIIIKKE